MIQYKNEHTVCSLLITEVNNGSTRQPSYGEAQDHTWLPDRCHSVWLDHLRWVSRSDGLATPPLEHRQADRFGDEAVWEAVTCRLPKRSLHGP